MQFVFTEPFCLYFPRALLQLSSERKFNAANNIPQQEAPEIASVHSAVPAQEGAKLGRVVHTVFMT